MTRRSTYIPPRPVLRLTKRGMYVSGGIAALLLASQAATAIIHWNY